MVDKLTLWVFSQPLFWIEVLVMNLHSQNVHLEIRMNFTASVSRFYMTIMPSSFFFFNHVLVCMKEQRHLVH